MENDAYEWQLARYQAAADLLHKGNRLTRTQLLRSEQIRISRELLKTPLPQFGPPGGPNEIQNQGNA